MISIDAVIESLPTMSEPKRATWATNAANVIARGPRCNPAYANALHLRDAIVALEATRRAEDALISACGLDWDRAVKDRTTFRRFDGDRLVARVTRVRSGRFIAQVRGAALPRYYATLSAAHAAAVEAASCGGGGRPLSPPRAA